MTTTAMTTVRTAQGSVLTLSPTALASGRYDVAAVLEVIPARSERRLERRLV